MLTHETSEDIFDSENPQKSSFRVNSIILFYELYKNDS